MPIYATRTKTFCKLTRYVLIDWYWLVLYLWSKIHTSYSCHCLRTTKPTAKKPILDRINTTLTDGSPRLHLRYSEIRSHDPALADAFRSDPFRHLRALEAAANTLARDENPQHYLKNYHQQPLQIGLEGPIRAHATSPRHLAADSLRQLVCVQGVATKVSACQPKVVSSVHYCPATQKSLSKSYVDATDPQLGLPVLSNSGELPDQYIRLTNAVYPTRDEQGNALETEYGLSSYKDYQTIRLQEMPESAPLGQLPRSVELVLDRDWVDRVKPGDRIAVTGVYRALAVSSAKVSSFATAILVSHIRILGRGGGTLEFCPSDIQQFRTLSTQPQLLRLLGQSIAPSIHGHARIKQAIALQLLAGRERNLENGTHLRGDINILLVGDPSTAKSQLLRAAMQLAPLAVSTTGKGSSGVGLTAAVTIDAETKERQLEAGAMVLADRGLVCVDEFDKLSEADRVALHEAMEQQTVTIAKAGMHASLNARCAVLAAANPVYGQYDPQQRVTENVGLPDSLLSRFDLLFIVLDQMDPVADRRIAEHVVQSHRRGGPVRCSTQQDDDEDAEEADRMWDVPDELLSLKFLRKYLHYAKTCRRPTLTDVVRDLIVTRYAELRAAPSAIAVTARSLETLIRLATAHAKLRLSQTVDVEDVTVALEIVRFALFHEEEANASGTKEDEPSMQLDEDDGGDEGSPFKRARLNPADDDVPLLGRIWNILSECGGESTVDELTTLVGEIDSDGLDEALEELTKQGKIQREGHSVFSIC